MGGLGEVATVLPEQHAANFEFVKVLEFSVLLSAECRMCRSVAFAFARSLFIFRGLQCRFLVLCCLLYQGELRSCPGMAHIAQLV